MFWIVSAAKRRGADLLVGIKDFYRSRRRVHFRNRENEREYDFVLRSTPSRAGVTAMLRVKNEESKIVNCLSSILDTFDEIVLVDNNSTDRTVDLVRRFKQRHDRNNKINLYSYPFAIARYGEEHAQAPADSMHSPVYYYNWSLSRCSCGYVFKWDADMILLNEGRERLRALLQTLSRRQLSIWSVPIQTVYKSQDGTWFLAVGEINQEGRLFPNCPAVRYYKADLWEVLRSEIRVERRSWPHVQIYELKDTTEDEFSHWTDRAFQTKRKKREWENFQRVKAGRITPDRFTRIDYSFLCLWPQTQCESGDRQ